MAAAAVILSIMQRRPPLVPTDGISDVRFSVGFTLMEIVVAVLLMALLGGMIIPVGAQYLDRKRSSDSLVLLVELGAALKTFRATVGNSPKRLSHLATTIVAGDTTSCTGTAPTTTLTYGATNAPKWATAGPYTFRSISKTGFPLPIGTANDVVVRTSANTAGGFLNITVPNLEFDDALEVNALADGPADPNQGDRSNTTGSIQWSAPVNERVTLTYSVPVGKTC